MFNTYKINLNNQVAADKFTVNNTSIYLRQSIMRIGDILIFSKGDIKFPEDLADSYDKAVNALDKLASEIDKYQSGVKK